MTIKLLTLVVVGHSILEGPSSETFLELCKDTSMDKVDQSRRVIVEKCYCMHSAEPAGLLPLRFAWLGSHGCAQREALPCQADLAAGWMILDDWKEVPLAKLQPAGCMCKQASVTCQFAARQLQCTAWQQESYSAQGRDHSRRG